MRTIVRPPLVLALVLILVVAGLTGSELSSTSSRPTAAQPGIYWGAYVEGTSTYRTLYGGEWGDSPWDSRTVAKFEDDAGKAMSVEHYGLPAFWKASFDTNAADLVASRGAIPAIDVSTDDARLRDVADGRYDGSIRRWAEEARAFGHPFFLLFNEEMNGDWYPYAVGGGRNTPAAFIASWRHVHDVFEAAHATNVTWVWCPNVDPDGALAPYDAVYPGDAYVDWTCLNGYNWGRQGWLGFAQVFGRSYRSLLRVAPDKPVMIGEVGSDERGGSKARWISDALTRQLPRHFRRVKALLWFNWRIHERGQWWPWQIESSPSAERAFARGIASAYYRPGGDDDELPSLTKVPPPGM